MNNDGSKVKRFRGEIPLRYRLSDGYEVNPDTGCWEWQRCRTTDGYGVVGIGGKSNMARVHYVTYEREYGQVPDGMLLDHLCRNPPCCNPEHLEPVSWKVNVLRGEGPTAKNARKTHCIHGHELTEDNVYRSGKPRNGRHCRECALRRAREQKQKRKGATP